MLDFFTDLVIEYKVYLIITVCAIIIDFITGITKAVYNKNIQSEKLRKTIPKIIGYFAIILICTFLQILFNIDFLIKIICIFEIIIEFISTIENINEFVTIPNFLVKFLENKKEEINNIDIEK